MSDEIDLSHVEIQDHNELMEYIRILLEKVSSLTALYNDNLTLLNDHNEAANAHVDIRTTILDNAADADTKLDNLRTEINNLINIINGEINTLENRATDIEEVNDVQNDRLDSAEYDLSLKIYDSNVSGVGHTGDFDDLLYRPNIVIKDADSSNAGVAVKLSKNRIDLKLPSTIKANIVGNVSGDMMGNAATATKLKTARSINGTNFDGSSNITTANWGTARNVRIQDHNGGHTGGAVTVNGSNDVTLKLPSTINADIVGYLTGNISGSAGSVAWGNVSGRPWALSQFSNNSGFITSEIDSSGTGWVRFKCGIQFCWYDGGLGFWDWENVTHKSYTFPVPFINNGYSLIGAIFRIQNTGGQGIAAKYSSSFIIGYTPEYPRTSTGGYLAIGRWK